MCVCVCVCVYMLLVKLELNSNLSYLFSIFLTLPLVRYYISSAPIVDGAPSPQCFTDKQKTKNVEVWMASVLGTSTMISIMNLSVKSASPQVSMCPTAACSCCYVTTTTHLALCDIRTLPVYVTDQCRPPQKPCMRPYLRTYGF